MLVLQTTVKSSLPIIISRRCFFQSTRLRQLHHDKENPKDYNIRVGYAIATLQDDLPHFFQKGLTQHSIYSTDIILSDPHYTKLSIHGRTAYLGIAQMLRWSTSMYFDNVLCEITKMRVLPEDEPDNISPNDDEYQQFSSIEQTERDLKQKGTVKRLEVRWKLQGTKHNNWFQREEGIRHIEGVFIYKFDHLGYIGEHRIQRIVPPPSKRVLYIHSLGVRLRSLFWDNQGKRAPVLNPGF